MVETLQSTMFMEAVFTALGLRRYKLRPPYKNLQCKRILVVRLDEIGDVILTGPFLKGLRDALPQTAIDLVVSPKVYNFVELCPYVDRIHTLLPPREASDPSFSTLARFLLFSAIHFWPRRPEISVSPRWDTDLHQSLSLIYLSGAPVRIAHQRHCRAHRRTLATHCLNNKKTKPGDHEVIKNLTLLSFMAECKPDEMDNRLESWKGRQDKVAAQRILRSQGYSGGRRLIAVAPGAGDAKRRWPLEHFKELSRWMIECLDAFVCVLGSEADRSFGKILKAVNAFQVIDATSQTTLREASALLSECTIFIGNDSGLMHMATAEKIPVIEISCHSKISSDARPNSPTRFGPWKVSNIVLRPQKPKFPCTDSCKAARAHCIKEVSVAQVKSATLHLLRSKTAE